MNHPNAPRSSVHGSGSAASDAALTHGRPARHQRGQGMTEYIVIVSLIAVAAIGIYTLFGQTLRDQTAGLAMELSGQDAATAIANAQGRASLAQTNANVRKGLDNYNASNRP
jgi:Flp pilus assembly pilin Flp